MKDTLEQADMLIEPRRDFLVLLTGMVTMVGAGCAIWPFVDSMNPSADVIAAGGPVDIDLTHLQPGQQIQVMWQSHPIFIIRRTAEELKVLEASSDAGFLLDPKSQAFQQPPYATNWHRSIKPEYLVLVGICTHLGCIPRLETVGQLDPTWPGGYFCPCHGSKYDLSGRVYKGVPAPYNLPVPPHRFVSGLNLRLGENPKGSTFDFGSIQQI